MCYISSIKCLHSRCITFLVDAIFHSFVVKAHLEEQRRLKEENDQLKQQSLCTKCKTNDVCIVFLPCGHLITCETCAPTVKYCTVASCGKYIKGTVRTYLS